MHGPGGITRELEAVIDTGYNDYLTLPSTIVTELGLPLVSTTQAFLADGTEASFDVYEVTVMWDQQPVQITAYESSSIPLVGMALLRGHNLNIDVERGGRVTIQANQ